MEKQNLPEPHIRLPGLIPVCGRVIFSFPSKQEEGWEHSQQNSFEMAISQSSWFIPAADLVADVKGPSKTGSFCYTAAYTTGRVNVLL